MQRFHLLLYCFQPLTFLLMWHSLIKAFWLSPISNQYILIRRIFGGRLAKSNWPPQLWLIWSFLKTCLGITSISSLVDSGSLTNGSIRKPPLSSFFKSPPWLTGIKCNCRVGLGFKLDGIKIVDSVFSCRVGLGFKLDGIKIVDSVFSSSQSLQWFDLQRR